MKKITQIDMMYAEVKEIFGSNFSIYSTNYQNPGRRYQVERINENGGASIFGANLTKKSFKDALKVARYVISNMTEEEKMGFWKRETSLKQYK